MVCMSASVDLLLHHHSPEVSVLAQADPGGPGKRAIKWLWCGTLYMGTCGLVIFVSINLSHTLM